MQQPGRARLQRGWGEPAVHPRGVHLPRGRVPVGRGSRPRPPLPVPAGRPLSGSQDPRRPHRTDGRVAVHHRAGASRLRRRNRRQATLGATRRGASRPGPGNRHPRHQQHLPRRETHLRRGAGPRLAPPGRPPPRLPGDLLGHLSRRGGRHVALLATRLAVGGAWPPADPQRPSPPGRASSTWCTAAAPW